MPEALNTTGMKNGNGNSQQFSSKENWGNLLTRIKRETDPEERSNNLKALKAEVAKLSRTLRLQQDGKISGFNQIIISCLHQFVSDIEKFHIGHKNMQADFMTLLKNPHETLNLSWAESEHPELFKAAQEYKAFSQGWHDALLDIQQCYQEMLGGTRNISNVRRWFYRTYYNGKFSDSSRYATLIELWDHLALVDEGLLASGEMQAAVARVQKNPTDAVVGFEDLVGQFYSIFEEVRDKHYSTLNQYVEALLSQLEESYPPKEAHRENFQKFCRDFLLFRAEPTSKEQTKDEYEQLKEKIDSLFKEYSDFGKPKKLMYDLRILREKIISLEKQTHQKTKKLKVLTQRFSQEMGFGSRIIHSDKKEINQADARNAEEISSPYIVARSEGDLYIDPIKQNKRSLKARHKKIARVGASGMAIGEGTVAGVGLFIYLIALGLAPEIVVPLSLFVGLAGAFCNYFLVRDVTYLILNEFRFGSFKDTPRWKILAISFFSVVSLATGFVYGALSASSIYIQVLKPLFLSAGLSTHLAIGLGVACTVCPVLLTAICLGSILFYTVYDFIKNDRISDIKAYFKTYDLPWSEMSRTELGINLGICCFNALKLVVGLVLSAVITIVTFGILHQSSLAVLSAITKPSTASTLSYSLTGVNVLASTAFGMEAVSNFLKPITAKNFGKAAVKGFFGLLDIVPSVLSCLEYAWDKSRGEKTSPSLFARYGLYSAVDQWFDKKVRGDCFSLSAEKCALDPDKRVMNKAQKKNKAMEQVVTSLALSSSGANGAGQEGLMLSNTGPLNVLFEKIPYIGPSCFWLASSLTFVGESIISFVPNIRNTKASLNSSLCVEAQAEQAASSEDESRQPLLSDNNANLNSSGEVPQLHQQARERGSSISSLTDSSSGEVVSVSKKEITTVDHILKAGFFKENKKNVRSSSPVSVANELSSSNSPSSSP